jgi:hypothetical protein
MANPSLTHSNASIKFNPQTFHHLEKLLCQASGLAQLLVEEVVEYNEHEPLHQTLWILSDLILQAKSTSWKMAD